MRWFLLAVALIAAGASPAFAQKNYGNRTPTHRATYANQGKSPVKYAAMHQQGEVVAAPAASGCTSCGQHTGCNSCASRGCPCPPLLPNLVDNVADIFARFKPCPSKCSPCARTVHCCPYPKTMPPSFCCHRRLPGLLDSIFVCNKGCCKQSSCCEANTCSASCQSCAAGAPAAPAELIHPPAPMPEMRESPFKDDPAQAKAQPKYKTAATPRHWYKTARPVPVYAVDKPERIVFDDTASPIVAE